MGARARALLADREGHRRPVILEAVGSRVALHADDPSAALPTLPGAVSGRFADAHVHLALVDPAPLAGSPVGSVLDLGAEPQTIRDAAAHGIRGDGPPARIEFAGAFLTPPGGYPSNRSWAPAGSFREIADAADAHRAVADMATAGASVIKVADNATAGPVFDDDLFRTIVAAAAEEGLAVVAHAEGRGEAVRAARLGARMLAHAPFDEVLSPDDIALLARTVTWISTLDIHGWGDADPAFGIAVENVARFHAAGGRVRYGTDMGNGPTPVGLNGRELTALSLAGLDTPALLRALLPDDPVDARDGLVLLPPGEDDIDLHAARLLTANDIKECT